MFAVLKMLNNTQIFLQFVSVGILVYILVKLTDIENTIREENNSNPVSDQLAKFMEPCTNFMKYIKPVATSPEPNVDDTNVVSENKIVELEEEEEEEEKKVELEDESDDEVLEDAE